MVSAVDSWAYYVRSGHKSQPSQTQFEKIIVRESNVPQNKTFFGEDLIKSITIFILNSLPKEEKCQNIYASRVFF